MKTLLILIISLFFLKPMMAQEKKARYAIKVRVNTGERYTGRFISINDTTLTMYGPIKSMDKLFIVGSRKMDYRIITAKELSSIQINRVGAPLWMTGTGFTVGLIVGTLILQGESNSPQTLVLMAVTAPFAGGILGAVAADPLTARSRLKNLHLPDFSSIKDQFKRYEAR